MTQPKNLRSAPLQRNAVLAELPPKYGNRFLHSEAMTDNIKYANGYILFIKEVRLGSQPLGESLAALTHILINLKHTEREVFFDGYFINVNVVIRCWDHLTVTVKHVKPHTPAPGFSLPSQWRSSSCEPPTASDRPGCY